MRLEPTPFGRRTGQWLADQVRRVSAPELIKELERIGILAGEMRGRQVIYRHPALLEALAA